LALMAVSVGVLLATTCDDHMYKLGEEWVGQEDNDYWTEERQNANEYRNHTILINQTFLYVLLKDGRLILSDDPAQRHSFIARGQPVLAAGNVRTLDGDVVVWDNESGHYKPGPASMLRLSQWLMENDPCKQKLALGKQKLALGKRHEFRIWKATRWSARQERCMHYFVQLSPQHLQRVLKLWMPNWLSTVIISKFVPHDAAILESSNSNAHRNLIYLPWPLA